MKTSELTGAALDWAVTKCEGFDTSIEPGETWRCWGWATDWAQGGPIIEREMITVLAMPNGSWATSTPLHTFPQPTPLIAAMRCYVEFKLGDEVDVPDELTQGESK